MSVGDTLRGESGVEYRLDLQLGRKNVWLAVNSSSPKPMEFIAKAPPEGDNEVRGWPAFQHELSMHRLFAEAPMQRKLVDFVLGSELATPLMILEPMTRTLWDARNRRPLTRHEIKWVMRGVLLGIASIHVKGMVFTGLLTPLLERQGGEDRLIGIDLFSGFDPEKPNSNVREIIVRLIDLGSGLYPPFWILDVSTQRPDNSITVGQPSNRKITSLTYRSPEVHFGKRWDQSADIWSWGIILAQLLQTSVDYKAPGLYDDVTNQTLEDKTRTVRNRLAVDFDLHSVPFYAEDPECRALLPPPQPDEAYMWANSMVEKGVPREDIQFLVEVLQPHPSCRLNIREILESGFFGS